MAQKDPIEHLFEEISSMLRLIEKNLNNIPSAENLPTDIDQRLDAIEKRVEALNRISEDIVRSVDVSREEMKMRLEGVSPNIPEKDKEILAKGDSIKTTVGALEKIYKDIDKARATDEKAPDESAPSATTAEEDVAGIEELFQPKKEEKPVEGRRRKSKFKRFGGDDKWKPL